MSSISPLDKLRQHYSNFPEVFLSVLLWKWRRMYNTAVERPLVSSGWTRRTENLRKKCKLRSDAKHGSQGDLARELNGGFLVQPREASSWSRSVQSSTLRDLDPIKQMVILYSRMAHNSESF